MSDHIAQILYFPSQFTVKVTNKCYTFRLNLTYSIWQCSIWSATFSNTEYVGDVICSRDKFQPSVNLRNECCKIQNVSLGLCHFAFVFDGDGLADAVVSRDAVLVNAAYLGNFIFRTIKINIAMAGGLRNMNIAAYSLADHDEIKSSSLWTVARMSPHWNDLFRIEVRAL